MGRKSCIITLLCVLFAIPLIMPSAFAFDRVIANSGNWQDVYSSMLFASLEGKQSNFLVSQKHGAILLYSIPTTESLLVVSSRQQPYVFSYKSFLESRGYKEVEELSTRTANLDLAARFTNISKYIIIDPAYGYNAISAAPYAIASRHYVLFADSRNIDDVVAFLEERTPDSVILFGQLDREVKDAMAQFSPETINEGDRFSNNLVLVDRYLTFRPTKQVILTNGEFIEAGLMNGKDPVIFIGKTNVPDIVRDYIKKSDTEVGILIGNELISTATFIRRQLGISVFVKFAQGARTPKGAVAQVEDLDRFKMPSYDFLLEIVSISYNKATRSLEVTYRNPTDLALYLKGTITVDDDGEKKVTGDTEPVFIDKRGTKTIVYTIDTDGNPLNLLGNNLAADLFTIYGEGPKAMENALQAHLAITSIDILDDTQVEIVGVYYDKSAQKFFVTVENVGEVDAYVQPEMVDLLINDQTVTVASDAVVLVKKGRRAKIPISIAMVDADFAANPTIKVRAFYGERELALIKMTEKSFALQFGGGSTMFVVYGAIILVIVLLFLFLGTKKRCTHCGHKNARGRKVCEKCGKKL